MQKKNKESRKSGLADREKEAALTARVRSLPHSLCQPPAESAAALWLRET